MSQKIQRGYLYWVDLNPPIKTKPGKVRPCVIVQSDFANHSVHNSTIIVPTTTQLIDDGFFHLRIPQGSCALEKECDILVSQTIAISKKSILEVIGPLPSFIFEELENRIKILLDFIP